MIDKSKLHKYSTGILLISMLCIVTISMIGTASANSVASPTVTKTASPSDINIAGSGTNEITTVTITATGAGNTTTTSVPLDIVFTIDSSGSMESSDPSNLRLQAANDFIDKMEPTKDAAGVVSWDDDIDFTQALTSNFADAKSSVNGVNREGNTDLSIGLAEAINILDANTKTEKSAEVIIFLSDGEGDYSHAIAQSAADKGYTIYSIGLGDSVNVTNLEDMSTTTGGTYYSAPTAETLDVIFNNILTEVTTSTIPQYVDVIEVTQKYIIEEGSFNVEPDSVVMDDSTGITTITWNNIGLIKDNEPDLSNDEKVVLSFNAKSDQSGSNLGVDVLGTAKVCYKDIDGNNADCVDIPQAYINVEAKTTTQNVEETVTDTFRLAPSVSLTSTKNTVETTDPALISLSMINPSVNDVNLAVDVIIKAPSGVYVTATSFASSGSNQNIGNFIVRPGEENHVTIQITSTEIGEKALESQVIYYPEGNKDEYRMLQQTMPFFVEEKSEEITPEPVEEEPESQSQIVIPGFSFATSIACLAIALFLFKRK
jgi:secreted protein with Ig-like and vWFA domain